MLYILKIGLLMLKLLMRSSAFVETSHSSRAGIRTAERAVSDLASKIIENNGAMGEKKILSFEEYKQKHCESLEDYIKSMKPSFPEKTDQMFEKTHQRVCASEYRAYKKESLNPGYNPGLMLDSEFFKDEK